MASSSSAAACQRSVSAWSDNLSFIRAMAMQFGFAGASASMRFDRTQACDLRFQACVLVAGTENFLLYAITGNNCRRRCL
jgi:hypothetical protein